MAFIVDVCVFVEVFAALETLFISKVQRDLEAFLYADAHLHTTQLIAEIIK